MTGKIVVDLHKLSKFANLAIPLFAVVFFLAGKYISFYFHFLTVAFLFLTGINFFYRYLQRGHVLLRNFGILAQGRYLLESVGPELRQYLFASDTEEKPFNRNERGEVYRKAQNLSSAYSYGSQKLFDAAEIKIRHSLFPIDRSDLDPYRLIFGEERNLPNAYTLRKPYIISGMSYGALGSNAVRCFARGAKLSGIPMNTGEGGYPKYHLMEGCDIIFQLGTAKFGARNQDGSLDPEALRRICAHEHVKMVEIKFSQGAKPGKGGILPKEKISEEIAELRGIPRDKDVESPPCHVECRDVASTVDFIAHVQEIAQLPVGMKLCIGNPNHFRDLAREMNRRETYPDWITIDGAEGGTGAAPKSFMDRVGMPLFPALKFANDTLQEEGARDRLKLIASGKLIGPGRQLTAMCLGADAIASARGFMLAIGCIQAMQCGSNTCPVGITTHDPQLQRGLDIEVKSVRVRNYIENLQHDMEELLAAAGCRSIKDLSFEHLYVPPESTLFPFLQSQ